MARGHTDMSAVAALSVMRDRSHDRNWPLSCALGGTRTPNLLIRSQMLYPLSYERSHCSILHSEPSRWPRPDGWPRGLPSIATKRIR